MPRVSNACPRLHHLPMGRKCRCAAYRIDRSPARRTRHSVDGSRARATGLLCVAGGPSHINRRISDFLKREAARDLVKATRGAMPVSSALPFKRISVRDQSSRWGSCSNTGVLVVLLAADSRAAFRARLPRCARGLPSCRAQSLAAFLASGRACLPAFRARQDMARRAWRRPAPLWACRRARRRTIFECAVVAFP